ncbi:MAG TPA: hypothetical protein VGO43_01995 [Pyrinomonadaceae bacterium]|jgi:hypothetical protein|nr:hypothetical protein [Pyrinomonadaceae bacterium]
MLNSKLLSRAAAAVLALSLLSVGSYGQKRKGSHNDTPGRAVLWERVDVGRQDTYLGPGGKAMQPDLSKITFIKEETGGHSKKFRVKDGAGNEWVAKVSDEAQSETASVRLLSALGYVTEINYLVPSLTIPGKGTFRNVRLEARPDNVKRGKEWKWGSTPFEKTPQMKGLMLMMAFINNWDMKSANNVIIRDGNQDKYVISDLGVSFGKTGNNPLPIFFRLGRSRNKPGDYARTRLVSGVSRDEVRVVFNGKNRSRMHDFSHEDARWLADLLLQLSDAQIRDMFRAANYSAGDIHILTRAVKDRIAQLDRAASDRRLAGRR